MTNFNYKEVDSTDEILRCAADLMSKIRSVFVSVTGQIKNIDLPLMSAFSEDEHFHLVLKRKPVYTGSSFWFISHEQVSLLWGKKFKIKYLGSVEYDIFIQDNKLCFRAYGCNKKVLNELSKIEGFRLETPC